MNDRKCLHCKEQLRGRLDQKFCSDQCRSAYNNSQNFEVNCVVKKINRILKKNYSILAILNANGKTTVNKNDLLQKGYCFDYFTCIFQSRNSDFNYFCYDHGYREKDHDKLLLVRREKLI